MRRVYQMYDGTLIDLSTVVAISPVLFDYGVYFEVTFKGHEKPVQFTRPSCRLPLDTTNEDRIKAWSLSDEAFHAGREALIKAWKEHQTETRDRLDSLTKGFVILGSYILRNFEAEINYETRKREFEACVRKLEDSGAIERLRERMASEEW